MYKEFDNQVNEILSKMTLKEKIGQLNQVMGPLSREDAEKLKKEIRGGQGWFAYNGIKLDRRQRSAGPY